MNNMEFTPNSHKYKAEQKSTPAPERKIEKVVTGGVKLKKKNDIRKFTDVFISEDASNVKSYILMDVLIPALKNTILDIITDSANMIFGGGKRRTQSGSKISYRNYYEDKNRYGNAVVNPEPRSRFDYDDIVFASRGDAEAVLEQMIEVIDRYGFVTVADMYDMCDRTQPYTSNKYAWTNLSNVESRRVPDGYVLKLPKARPID